MTFSESPGRPPAGGNLETTASLLARVRQGDAAARERLFARALPLLRQWAHGRLPVGARQLADTEDLVQISLVRALNRLESFEPTREGAFLVYLRRILLNALRDEIRRSRRSRISGEPDDNHPAAGPSTLEQVIGREALEDYEAALAQLSEEQREAVILRVEFGFKYEEIAEAMGRPSTDAARMTVTRAIRRLAEAMDVHRT